jgi:2-polyprenyl-3-methyl-5-hydroxy-6-metoxy-1,4-benzoquinol methylase
MPAVVIAANDGTTYMMSLAMDKCPTDAVAYFSGIASSFHNSYSEDANRQERIRVWNLYFDRFATRTSFGYDIGCGSGILACELARRGVDMIGIDGASNMLSIAESSAREQMLRNVTFQKHRLPISDTTSFRIADLIISSSALEYLDSMPEALGFLHRMLRPGGVLIFSVSNYDSLSRKAVRVVHAWTGKPAYFGLLKQFTTVEDVCAVLRATGFTLLAHSYFAKADRINRTLGMVMPERFASNMIIVAARRNQCI